MARQYKKILKKIKPKNVPAVQQEKPGNDLLLLGIIVITLIVMAVGWDHFDDYNRALYMLLASSLILTYTSRHSKLSDRVQNFVGVASLVCMGLAAALFLVIVYNQFFS